MARGLRPSLRQSRSRAYTHYRAAMRGGADWTPYDIGADLTLWLDGSDISTLDQNSPASAPVTADDDTVGVWADKSANGNDYAEATNKPLYKTNIQNGLSVIRFDGTNDSLGGSAALTATTTIAIVCTPTAGAGDDYIWGGSMGAAKPTIITGYGGKSFEYLGAEQSDISVGASGFNLITIQHIDSTSYTTRLNGTVVQDGAAATDVWATETISELGVSTGTANAFQGDIAELIVTSGTMPSELEPYLLKKWGI